LCAVVKGPVYPFDLFRSAAPTENIVMPLATIHGFKRAEVMEAAEKTIKEAHLRDEVRDRLSADARSLSGGERLYLARTLVVVSHSLDFALRLADDIIGLREGQAHRHLLPRKLKGASGAFLTELEAMY